MDVKDNTPESVSTSTLTFVPRSEWRARESRENNYMTDPVSLVFIHHTAMKSCDNMEDGCEEMREIQNLHMDDRGWDDIGYNFLVSEGGHVFIGRDWTRIGAHTLGFNAVAIAISVMGNFNERIPNDKAIETIKNLIEVGVKDGKINSDYRLYGHRDVRETDCPGHMLYDIIKTWDHAGHDTPQKPS